MRAGGPAAAFRVPWVWRPRQSADCETLDLCTLGGHHLGHLARPVHLRCIVRKRSALTHKDTDHCHTVACALCALWLRARTSAAPNCQRPTLQAEHLTHRSLSLSLCKSWTCVGMGGKKPLRERAKPDRARNPPFRVPFEPFWDPFESFLDPVGPYGGPCGVL